MRFTATSSPVPRTCRSEAFTARFPLATFTAAASRSPSPNEWYSYADWVPTRGWCLIVNRGCCDVVPYVEEWTYFVWFVPGVVSTNITPAFVNVPSTQPRTMFVTEKFTSPRYVPDVVCRVANSFT